MLGDYQQRKILNQKLYKKVMIFFLKTIGSDKIISLSTLLVMEFIYLYLKFN